MKELIERINTTFTCDDFLSDDFNFPSRTTYECEEIRRFLSEGNEKLCGELLEEFFDVLYWVEPSGFEKLLPRIMKTSIEEVEPNLLVVSALIGMLDVGDEPNNWGAYMLQCWGLLSRQQLEVVLDWIVWISDCQEACYEDVVLTRSFNAISLLMKDQ
ncbi:hypothetical protein [Marinagarivorans algicola]|uniref:hypothetical protein n=1 Tax=Marinagarivorans algicola TaxID=1513270 RepID=UPI0006B8900E|nr:hypothetical protein [Marinagarivorans algicola]